MKQIFLLAYFIFLPFLSFTQYQIPNSNFEDWTVAYNGTDSLIDWSSSNAVVIYPVRSLYAESDSYQGEYSANIVTAPFGFVQYSTIGILVNGKAKFTYGGGGNEANVSYASGGGTPISYKPQELKGFYKTSTLSNGDLPMAEVVLTKYNSNLNKRDTVSYSVFHFNASSSNYTAFSIPLIDLLPNVTPDTITTIFYSSNPSLVYPYGVWSNLYLDNLILSPENTSGTGHHIPKGPCISIFPNPSNGEFKIQNLENIQTNIEIYNQLGMLVKLLFIDANKSIKVDLANYPKGVYYIKSGPVAKSVKKILLID